MGDFDESTALYYSHQNLQLDITSGANPDGTHDNDESLNDAALRAAQKQGGDTDEDDAVSLDAIRRHFREFLRESLFLLSRVLAGLWRCFSHGGRGLLFLPLQCFLTQSRAFISSF